jgi:formate-dependent nitrite reductase cytochrome c552 subunit
MPYVREGAAKVSDHWVRSPLLQVNRACGACHPVGEAALQQRVSVIQGRRQSPSICRVRQKHWPPLTNGCSNTKGDLICVGFSVS